MQVGRAQAQNNGRIGGEEGDEDEDGDMHPDDDHGVGGGAGGGNGGGGGSIDTSNLNPLYFSVLKLEMKLIKSSKGKLFTQSRMFWMSTLALIVPWNPTPGKKSQFLPCTLESYNFGQFKIRTSVWPKFQWPIRP